MTLLLMPTTVCLLSPYYYYKNTKVKRFKLNKIRQKFNKRSK